MYEPKVAAKMVERMKDGKSAVAAGTKKKRRKVAPTARSGGDAVVDVGMSAGVWEGTSGREI